MSHTKVGGLAMQLKIPHWVPGFVVVYNFGRNIGCLKKYEDLNLKEIQFELH